MSPPLELLPRRLNECWQGAVLRLPIWIVPRDGAPFRPLGGVWISETSPALHIEMQRDNESESAADLALRSLSILAGNLERAGFLPGAVEVADEALAQALAARLQPLGVEVHTRTRVPLVTEAVRALAEDTGTNLLPGILEAPGMSLEQARSFFAAARAFYEAAPWQQLLDEDVFRIEAPLVPAEISHGLVLGAGGREFGLTLFASRQIHERMIAGDREAFDRCWSVHFDGIDQIPLADAELFEAHAFPIAGPQAYPWPVQFRLNGEPRRPSAKMLGRIELVLRALASTSEPEMDAGRWTRPVDVAGVPVEITLALPDLLGEKTPRVPGVMPRFSREGNERLMADMREFLRSQEFGSIAEATRALNARVAGRTIDELARKAPATPLEQAQELCWQAWDARGRKRRLLAQRALAASADCADAYVLLAHSIGSREEKLRLLHEGVAAGERALGAERFASDEGGFWGDVTTRPYMRALHGLAMVLADGGRDERKRAAEIGQRLIALNPDDNQGVRDPLVGWLLEAGDHDGARALLGQYADDESAIFAYARALFAYRVEGDTANSRKLLRRADRANLHVAACLAGREEPPPVGDSYGLQTPEEAGVVLDCLGEAWRQADGALDWLERTLRPPGGKPPRRASTGKKPRPGRRSPSSPEV